MRLPRLPLRALTALALLAGTAGATWSVVVVDTRTREVCVSSATCLANFDLQRFLPVVVVGRGAGAAQSVVDQGGFNRRRIFDGILRDADPATILTALANHDPAHQSRQYGIVTLDSDPVTFTGSSAGLARAGVTGVVGDLRYAIQGNLLTGAEVVTAAEAALLTTPGELGLRVMAAMQAARALGGDGRCSCSQQNPTQCGIPPPDFDKSAHTAFIVVAREGDVDGTCSGTFGCANGTYFTSLREIGNAGTPDPIERLAFKYAVWRQSVQGRPDHVLSRVVVDRGTLRSGSDQRARARIGLLDIDGYPVRGGVALRFEVEGGGAPHTVPGAVIDEGSGRYRVEFTAAGPPGQDVWRILADDGQAEVLLVRRIVLTVE